MKKPMKKLRISLIIITLILFPRQVYANEESRGDSTIRFELTGKDFYPYEVSVEGEGTVYEGEAKIRVGTMVYEMNVGETKTFEVVPDEGYQVKEITCDRDQMKIDGSIVEITQVSGTSHLRIVFEEQEKPDNPDNPKPDDPDNPKPDDPDNPKPDDPDNPKPDNPDNPKPDDPDNPKPDNPDNPKPDNPANPNPEDPVNPNPDDPSTPTPDETPDTNPTEKPSNIVTGDEENQMVWITLLLASILVMSTIYRKQAKPEEKEQ